MKVLSSVALLLIIMCVATFSVSCTMLPPNMGSGGILGVGGESADKGDGSSDSDNESSDSDNDNSSSDDENSGSDDENSGSDDENSGSDDENSGSDDENSGSDDENSGSEDDSGVGCGANGHTDADKNDYCDNCNEYLIVVIDLYAFNDLHGKFCDSDDQPGVDEIGTYFENRESLDDHIILLSSGDMWQGSAESVLTKGRIMVDWMNELGFVAMTLGNHEFDWGEEAIRDNSLLAEFPFLAINVYNISTGRLADYCAPSVIVECGDVEIGIIGAIGDCYSSISSEMVGDVTFKVGDELTALVKAESERLRGLGVDVIVFSIHDGLDGGGSDFVHYDTALSDGYVDVVFEGHTHQSYVRLDAEGTVHVQGGGENYGFSHVEIAVNPVTGVKRVNEKNVVTSGNYAGLRDHPETEAIEDKYSEIIDYAYSVLGKASRKYTSSEVEDRIAKLYLAEGTAKWGDSYDIVLGGGYLKTRSPYDLSAGDITYADVLSLLPFNNRIVLCKISGRYLLDRFINTTNSDYHIALKEGFTAADVNVGGTYYVIVDTYTALYRYNKLTIVDYYDDHTYARDLLADAVENGALDVGSAIKPGAQYDITPVSRAISDGDQLATGQTTSEAFYFKGTLSGFSNTKYGNCYLTDENGDQIYVYGLYDVNGNIYQSMANPPKAGDVVIVWSQVKKYRYPSGDIVIELINSVVVAVNP